MKIEIQTNGAALDDELRDLAQGLVESALGRCRRRIESVMINISDVSAPRDGKSTSCRVRVGLHGRKAVIAEVLDADARVAIRRAVDRASWTAMRSLRLDQNKPGNMLIIERHAAGQHEPEWAA